MNVRYMPESVLSSLQVLNNVIPMAALKSNYYYFPFSISEETEAQRSCQLAQNYRASESRHLALWCQSSQDTDFKRNLDPVWNIVPIQQGCGFDPWSRHIQGATSECMNKWNNNSMFFFLKSINKKLKKPSTF